MAVYTQLSAETLGQLIAAYDVGRLVSAKGIAEGVSNSNWLVETSEDRFILTMYERRIDTRELPFFLGLLDHLSAKGCPVPRTIHDREGAAFRALDGKAVALIEFLRGVSVDQPTPAQARNVGRALAGIHLAGRDYDRSRRQTLGLSAWRELAEQCGCDALEDISAGLGALIFAELDFLQAEWPTTLPRGVTHCDLFPDNVLMLGDEVTGLIDFYFAANDFFAYDLAVTHASWCFADGGRTFCPQIAAALFEGYESIRPLEPNEREHLPVLARGAAMRFMTSRAYDWLNTPAGALVTRKDPMDFARRLDFYRDAGAEAFSGGGA